MKNSHTSIKNPRLPARHVLASTISTLLVASLAPISNVMADVVVPPTFTNIANAAGLVTNRAVRGVGWGDYNGDGCPDVLLATQTGTQLFRNECNGTFTEVTNSAGMADTNSGWAAVWADYDGDGDLDAFVTNGGGQGNKLYQNNGDGTFTDVAAAAGVAGNQAFTGATFGDYDNDGDLDLFVAARFLSDTTDRLYRNNGNGTFTEVGGAAGVAGSSGRLTFMGAWFDYDNDGDLDLYVAVDFGNDTLYQNNGNGTFTDVGAAAGISQPQHGMGIAIGDINHDGCIDVASTNNGSGGSPAGEPAEAEFGPSALYINNCDGTFTNTPVSAGLVDRGMIEWGINFHDVDYDSDLDLAVVAGGMMSSGQPNVLHMSNGESFVDTTTTSGVGTVVGASFGSAWADFDGDGDLDWLVGNETGGLQLYRNDGPTGNHLKVKLNGAGMNTQGIGARIELRSGMRVQTRQLQAGLSYASSEEPIAVFGLGTRSAADVVKVTFPSGEVVTLNNVAGNQTIEVTETDVPPPPVCEAGTPGTISGTVTNTTTGLGEPGATVGLRNVSTLVTINTTTDAAGNYSFTNVATGTTGIDYRLNATKAGFTRGTATTNLGCGQTLDIDMSIISTAP